MSINSINNVFDAKVTGKPLDLGFSKETAIAVALGVVSEQSSNTQLALTGAEKLPFAPKSRIDFIKDLPENMVLAVSEFLAPEDLARVSCVNKECRALVSAKRLWDAFDLPKLYPGFSVIDEKVWREHVDVEALKINPAGARPLSNRELIPVVAHVSNKVEGKKGVTLFTIPKDFTINKALKLARLHRMPVEWIGDDILIKIGDIPVDETYQIAITNSVLEGSRNISFAEQEALVKKLRGTVPDIQAAIAFIVLKYITSSSTPDSVYNNAEKATFMRCPPDPKVSKYPLVVGGFARSGLTVCSRDCFDCDNFGVGGQWKF